MIEKKYSERMNSLLMQKLFGILSSYIVKKYENEKMLLIAGQYHLKF
jgi:hypothetical protein